ncbi:MAG: microcystin-dependent protein [Bacteroidia bacterium]|jgi:microcystin-dependent protein
MGPDPFLGTIGMFAGNFAPRGWAYCDGQLLPISQNTALFSIIGTIYGGDGRTTFALPDLRGRKALHPGNGPGLRSYRLGERGGTEDITLTISELPSHNHIAQSTATVRVADQNGDAFAANGNALGKRARDVETSAAIEVYADNATFGQGNQLGGVESTTTIINAGGQRPFQILNPFLCVNYCIALQGIFPSRN